MYKRICLGIALLSLSACAARQEAPPQPRKPAKPAAVIAPPVRPQVGIDRVMGKDARTLVGLFGQPVQDVQEPGARKLQFGGAGCILDTYLYPPAKGREPVVKYVDARLPDGRDTDRAACIMTLSRGR